MQAADRMGWGAVLPPPALTTFLESIKLKKYDMLFVELGYDDVEDFANLDDAELAALCENLSAKNVLPPHVGKVRRAINKMRGEASPPQMLNAFSSPVPISPVAVAVPPPLPCSGGLQAESPTAAQTPTAAFIGAASATSRNDAHAKKVREQAAPAQMRLCTDPPCACDLQASATSTIQLTANAVGVIAAAKQNASHVAKVTAFIEQRTKLHPEAPRILYGKGHDNQLLADY